MRGREAPIVGAVSMDLTLVDATDDGASPGDRVVCLGADAGRRVTAWDLARAAGTIPYEILCGIGPRVPRVYLAMTRFLEAIGRVVLRVLEEAGSFFSMLGRVVALGGAAALRRPGALAPDGPASASTRSRSCS